MTSAYDFRQVKELEETADRLGFYISLHSKYSGDRLGLYAKDDCLPIYSRDAELYTGSVCELLQFLRGWQSCQTYYTMLGFNKKKVDRAEQNHRNDDLLRALSTNELQKHEDH